MSYRSKNRISRWPRLLPAALAAVMMIVPFGGGFLQLAPAQDSGRVCFADGVKYRPGVVLRMESPESSVTKECSGGSWVRTSKAATAVLKIAAKSFCIVQPSTSPQFCRCQDGEYSLGAIIKTADETFLRCDRFELGKFTTWRAATRNELGAK